MEFAQPRERAFVIPLRLAKARRGTTLIELIVVLAIIGIVVGVSGLSMSATAHPPAISSINARLMQARDSAIASRHPITVSIIRNDTNFAATAYPDGRVVTNAPNFDRLAGRAETSPPSAPYGSR